MGLSTFSGPVASDNGFIVNSDNNNAIGITSPAALASSYTITLPPNDGTPGQVLTTDGSGVTTWTSAGGGSGTVTSVSGAGTVSGLTLTGTVTSSGSLTLGGTLNLSSPPAIGGTSPAAGNFTNLGVSGTFSDGSSAVGTSGQLLSSTGTGTAWVNAPAGTVASVSGSGNVNGITLTGTVTSSGSLTLGGSLVLVATTAINISTAASAINTSGKTVGKMVVDLNTGIIYTATGTAPTDPWGASDGTPVTPA